MESFISEFVNQTIMRIDNGQLIQKTLDNKKKTNGNFDSNPLKYMGFNLTKITEKSIISPKNSPNS